VTTNATTTSSGPGARRCSSCAAEPGDLLALGRQGRDGEVQQALLLPQHVAAAKLNEDVRVLVGEIEASVEGELDGDELTLSEIGDLRHSAAWIVRALSNCRDRQADLVYEAVGSRNGDESYSLPKN